MKTTIYPLLLAGLLLPLSMGQDSQDISILESTQIGFTDWTGDPNTPTYGSNTTRVTYSDNTLTFPNRISGGTGTSSQNMTISVAFRLNMEQFIVDDSSQTQPTLLFTVDGTQSDGQANSWSGVGVTKNGSNYNLAVYYNTGGTAQPTTPVSDGVFSTPLPTTGSINVVMTVGSNGTTLYFNQGETLPDTSHTSATAKWTGTGGTNNPNTTNGRNVFKIQFAGDFTDDIEQFYVWNTTLSQQEALEALSAMEAWATPAQAVPEPAVATLSLLGLSALLIRKRRMGN